LPPLSLSFLSFLPSSLSLKCFVLARNIKKEREKERERERERRERGQSGDKQDIQGQI
jgi:hypothetical protein